MHLWEHKRHEAGVRALAVVALFIFTWLPLVAQTSHGADDFFQRRERSALETITKQIEANGAPVYSGGPLIPDTRKLAKRLEAVLPEGRIQDEGKYGPGPSWTRAEIRSKGWAVEVRAVKDVQSAGREMAHYIASVQAFFQPGTMSGAPVGQARYFWDSLGIVFLRQNVVVWVRERDYPSRVYPPELQMAKECEGVATTVDQELVALLAGK